jgi:hypothetical protein
MRAGKSENVCAFEGCKVDDDKALLDGWYRLAAAVVKGISDPTEREEWRKWASERARRPYSAPLRTVQTTDLWTGEQKRSTTPRGSRTRTE